MESTSKLLFLIIVVATTCFAGCGALKMEGYFNSDFETQMEYVGRFVFNPDTHGRMLYDIKFPVNECCLSMIMFRGDESQWPLVRAHQDEMTCHEKELSVPGIQNSKIFFRLGQAGCFLDTDDNGQEIVHCVESKNMFVSHRDRWFYITFMNCHYLRNVGVHVDYKIQILNGNATLSREFSADESSNLAVTFISAVVLTTVIIFAIIQTVQLSQQRKLHTTYRIWLLSVCTQYVGVIISLVALFIFALDGYKRDASVLAAHVFTSVGNVIFTVILILIGKGYTITRLTIRTVGVIKIWLFVLAYSGVFITLYILKDFADPRDVRNIYDSEAAVGLVILRITALVWVLYGVCFTVKDYPKKRIFYSAFTLFITIWFLSEPLMILMSKYFIPLYCRAKVIDAMYLGTAIFGHVVFLCLTHPSATNRFFPFHLRTNQVDAVPFEYVGDIESQKFDGGFFDIFMTEDEKAKKNANQDRVPTISNIVSEKETDSATVTYVESIDLFPSSEKESSADPIQTARTRGRQRIYQYIEPEEDNTTGSVQAVTTSTQQFKTSPQVDPEEAITTRPVQSEMSPANNNTFSYLDLEEGNASRSVQALQRPAQHHTYSFLEPEEDNTISSLQAAETNNKQRKSNAYLELEKEIFPVQEIPSVRNPLRMYPSSESESDEDLNIITLDDISDKMAAKNSLPSAETITCSKGGRTSTKGMDQSFPAPLQTTILANEAALVYNNRVPIPNSTKNGDQARQPASRAKDAQRMNTSTSHKPIPGTAVRSYTTTDPPAPLQTDQTTAVIRKKKQRAPSTFACGEDQTTKDKVMDDQPPPLPRKKKHQAPSTDVYKQDEAISPASHGPEVDQPPPLPRKKKHRVPSSGEYNHDEVITAASHGIDQPPPLPRKKKHQAPSSYENKCDEVISPASHGVDQPPPLPRKKKHKNPSSYENKLNEELSAASYGVLTEKSAERMEKIKAMEKCQQVLEEKSAEKLEKIKAMRAALKEAEAEFEMDQLLREGASSVDMKEDRQRRRKMQQQKSKSLEGAASEEQEAKNKRGRTNTGGMIEEKKPSDMLDQEVLASAEAEKEERRRRRRAEKLLEKRQSSETHHTEDAASTKIDSNSRRNARKTLEGDMSSEMFYQEGENLADVEKEERRRRRRVQKMLETGQSPEKHHDGAASAEVEREEKRKAWDIPEENRSQEMGHQEGKNLADAEKEERRRRRRAKKMLEKRRAMEQQQESAPSGEAVREEKRKTSQTPEGDRSSETLQQEGVTLGDVEKEERRRRRAKKMLEKRQSSEKYQDGAASAAVEMEERRRRRVPELQTENRSPEMLCQEREKLPDAEEEERRKKMLEMRKPLEVTHQEDAAFAEAEREERRRRRRMRKNMEARRQAELEAQNI